MVVLVKDGIDGEGEGVGLLLQGLAADSDSVKPTASPPPWLWFRRWRCGSFVYGCARTTSSPFLIWQELRLGLI
jgi:hypothetical protein